MRAVALNCADQVPYHIGGQAAPTFHGRNNLPALIRAWGIEEDFPTIDATIRSWL
jgi:hypothetical protein